MPAISVASAFAKTATVASIFVLALLRPCLHKAHPRDFGHSLRTELLVPVFGTRRLLTTEYKIGPAGDGERLLNCFRQLRACIVSVHCRDDLSTLRQQRRLDSDQIRLRRVQLAADRGV